MQKHIHMLQFIDEKHDQRNSDHKKDGEAKDDEL